MWCQGKLAENLDDSKKIVEKREKKPKMFLKVWLLPPYIFVVTFIIITGVFALFSSPSPSFSPRNQKKTSNEQISNSYSFVDFKNIK